MLKALILAYDEQIQKTHDLELLAEQLSECTTIPESIFNAADSLTLYGEGARLDHQLSPKVPHGREDVRTMQLRNDSRYELW